MLNTNYTYIKFKYCKTYITIFKKIKLRIRREHNINNARDKIIIKFLI